MGMCGMKDQVIVHPILAFLLLYYAVFMSTQKKKSALKQWYLSTRIHELTFQ
jgi:hypothetical protein